MSTEKEFQGKSILITGGAKNLGALIATDYAKGGAKNILIHYHSSSSKEAGEKLASELKSNYGTDVVLADGDLSKAEVAKKIFSLAVSKFGGVDIAVDTVGMVLKKPLVDITEEEFAKLNASNNFSAFFFLQEAGKVVSKGGSIIVIETSLVAAYTPLYGGYAGTKAPVEHYVRALSKELQEKSINVNSVAPGPMDTPFFYGQETPESTAYMKTAAMGGRLTKIEDIAPIVLFLSGKGHWIDGQTILANGGFTTR